MLNPNNDRLDYGRILAPPVGYELDFAVGTTYSLDLDALVGASLALGLSEETDSVLMDNPVCLLEALRSVGDKVALFCEGGQIHMPGNVTALYILLEKMVFPVKTRKRRGIAAYPSFHPKFWLIRYKDPAGKLIYRIIVLSRNLTFDRSWDITYCMDGYVSDQETDNNEALSDFLRFLLTQTSSNENGKAKAKLIRRLIRELPRVEFEPPEKEFNDYEFLPCGVKRESGGYYRIDETPLFTDTFHEIMIISPFLSSGVIRQFNNRNDASPIQDPRYMLITRELSLGKLKQEDVSNFRIFTMRDTVIDGETALSDEQTDVQRQDIHAKVYMFRKYAQTDLYLGSLNASHNAIFGNVEFMIRLRSKNRYLNLDKLSAALFGNASDGSDNPFQEVTLQNAIISADEENTLDSVIKEINRGQLRAEAVEGENGYTVHLYLEHYDTGDIQVTVQPLLSNKKADYGEKILFEGLSIMQLSEFYVFTASDGERSIRRVLVVPTEGLPEDRERSVVSSVVRNKECFYRYIAFLLGDSNVLSMIEAGGIEGKTPGSIARRSYQIPALYEKMLKTAATAPEKFKGIEYLMKTISEDGIIPEEFETLYSTFKKAVKLNG